MKQNLRGYTLIKTSIKYLFMKKTAMFIMGLLFTATAVSQSETDQQSIHSLQEQLNLAVEQNNTEMLRQYLHPQFYVHQFNKAFIAKEDLLTGFKNGNNPYKVFRPKADTLIFIDKTTAITSGKEIFQHKKGEYANADHHREFYHIWKKWKGRWVLAARNVVFID